MSSLVTDCARENWVRKVAKAGLDREGEAGVKVKLERWVPSVQNMSGLRFQASHSNQFSQSFANMNFSTFDEVDRWRVKVATKSVVISNSPGSPAVADTPFGQVIAASSDGRRARADFNHDKKWRRRRPRVCVCTWSIYLPAVT